jgi:hypothetical protein
MTEVIIQQRLPSYDFVIRTTFSRSEAAARLDGVFRGDPSKSPALSGSFDGGAFTVSPVPLIHGNSPPAIQGYMVPNEEGGTDVVVRVGTMSSKLALAALAGIPAVVAVVAGIAADFAREIFLLTPFIAAVGPAIVAFSVIPEGQRVRQILSKALAAPGA